MKFAMTCEPDLTGILYLYNARLLNFFEDQNCAFLGYYAETVVITCPCFGTTYWFHPQGSCLLDP